ncbi:DDT domain-containing protein DDR4 isoform X2 [Argentina anserina]|uniref:DDT domain-containing protein DDR4 isoform X2 n=1 Tax=Argentina anserina TaxID=57926 RepID=UPI0021766C7F|nr:DDT domain-containing protein DDR4 isoform X2 [Potentilla anserina]
MAEVRRSSRVAQPATEVLTGKQKRPAEEDVKMAALDDEEKDQDTSEADIAKLRKRWELASVFNFLTVFEPVIGKLCKVSAEEIEMGLVTPNDSLARLHIAILKGIPPASKILDGSDAWVTVLCKKLVEWWPWVAEGEIPLVVAKGEEVLHYKGLDPTERLLMLKALCELRADQDDAAAFINDALKQGTEISSFRKDKIGGDEKRTSYWLYKEVTIIESKTKVKGKGGLNLPNTNFQWETLATNLEEFQEVMDELSSSKIAGERDAARIIETDAIPALEKLQKKKERELKKKERQERQQNLLTNFYGAGITRSCRNRRPVNYTFDDYDRVIHEAIKITNKRKSTEEKVQERKSRRNGTANNDAPERDKNSEDSDKEIDSANSDNNHSGMKDNEDSGNNSSNTESDMLEDAAGDEDDNNWDDDTKDEDTDEEDGNSSDKRSSKQEKNNAQAENFSQKWAGGVRWSSRLAGGTSCQVVENRNSDVKNRSRQRPVCNSALDSVVIQDSEDENSEGHENSETSEHENASRDIDPEEVSES